MNSFSLKYSMSYSPLSILFYAHGEERLKKFIVFFLYYFSLLFYVFFVSINGALDYRVRISKKVI